MSEEEGNSNNGNSSDGDASKSSKEDKPSSPNLENYGSDDDREVEGRANKTNDGILPNVVFQKRKNIKREVSTSLDQIIAVGNEIILAAQHRNEWIAREDKTPHTLKGPEMISEASLGRQEQERQTDSDNNSIGPTQNINEKIAIHAEDRVLYSHLQNVQYVNEAGSTGRTNLDSDSQYKETSGVHAPLFRWPVDYDDILHHAKVQAEHPNKRKRDECQGVATATATRRYLANETHVDSKWEHYFGDGIDEDDFLKWQAKRMRSTPKEDRNCTDREFRLFCRARARPPSPDTSRRYSGSRPKGELQEFIERAWHKAIHIASNTMEFSPTDKTPSTSSSESRSGPEASESEPVPSEKSKSSVGKDITDHRIQAEAILRCKQLEIEFDPILVSGDSLSNEPNYRYYTCQSCQKRIKYTSREYVARHLFGSKSQKGCCWILISEKERELIQDILERKVMNVVDSLLHIIFKDAKEKIREKNESAKRGFTDSKNGQNDNGCVLPPCNWLDIYNIMMDTLNNPSNFRRRVVSNVGMMERGSDLGKSCIEMLQVDPNLLPFPLNKDVMKIVLSRMIERYDGSSKTRSQDECCDRPAGGGI